MTLEADNTPSGERLCGQAVDGKTVRTATAHQVGTGRITHLVAVVGYEHGLVWAQANAATKLGERKVAERLLGQLPLSGTVTTFDALHTSFKQAKQIRRQGGHYLFIVKRNRKTLYQDIDEAFSVLPPQGSCELDFWQYQQWHSHERSHGRTVDYVLESTPALNDYLAFPDVAQVVRRTRYVDGHRTHRQRVHVEYLVTSLSRQLVSLSKSPNCVAGTGRLKTGPITRVMSALARTAVTCIAAPPPRRWPLFVTLLSALFVVEGWPYLPNAFRYCQVNLQSTLRWIGAIAT